MSMKLYWPHMPVCAFFISSWYSFNLTGQKNFIPCLGRLMKVVNM
jgi:hypothetical protein